LKGTFFVIKNILGAMALAIATISLSACGGGGSTPVSTPITSQSSSKGTVKVSFSVSKPVTASAAANTKHVDFVDKNSSSYNIYLNTASVASGAIAASNPACTAQSGGGYSCSVTFAAPVGSDTIGVILEDSTDYVLSDGETTSNIASGSNAVSVTLNGVATNAFVIPISSTSPNSVTMGIPVSGNFEIADHYLLDGAQDDIITQPGTYSNGPITMVETDSSGILTITGGSVSAPSIFGNNPFTLACTAPGTATVALETGGSGVGSVFGFPYTSSNYPATGTVLWNATVDCNSPASVGVIIDGKTHK
jgi:hypothetical protein